MFPEETRILVVDDMSSMVEFLKTELQNMGYESLYSASNGEEAFGILKKQLAEREPIELLLCDWSMPLMNGVELLRRIRGTAELKDLPFIMITAEGEADQVMEVINEGVSNYIVKPVIPTVLREKMKKVWKKIESNE